MKTVVIDKSARRITIRRVEAVVNGRNDCEDSELPPSVFLAKQARFAKRNCTLGKVSHSKEELNVTNGVERKGKQISFSRGDVTRPSADDGKTQSPASSSSADGNLSRKLTALERLKNLSFDTPQVRLQSLVSEKAQKPSRVPTELPISSTGDRLLLESVHGRTKQSPYRRSDNVHRPMQDGRRRDDAHCTLSSSEHSSSRSGGHRYDQQSSYTKRSHSTTDQRLGRSYNGYYLSRPNATCSDVDFSIFHPSADVAAIRETVFNWEKLSNLEFDESDLSACTRTELEVVAKFVLLRRASLNRSTAIMADEVSALQEAVETQKRWCDVLKCYHMYPHNSSINQCKLPSKTDAKQAKAASSTIDRESNQAAARLAASLAKQAQARMQALPSSHDAQMNSLCNAFFNGMISAMLDRINGKEEDSIA
ncbi:hypothetical protein M513_01328 [Trichuris suis]|uniref:Uncharacterized protein n=1 Tax=Trichuris suis TaxID=68888 RepID=A0A085MKB2_9BILA|nr:hypothetical protein M513_01328 [Trichuris suis]